jgi:plasmid maintenance system antidote protein VapI
MRRNTRLDWNTVRAIRLRYAETDATQTDLADEYGVAPNTVSSVLANTTWYDAAYTPITPEQKPRRPRNPQYRNGPPATVLDMDTVRRIRDLYADPTTNYTHKTLARIFGISERYVGNIIRNTVRHDPEYTPPPAR